MDIEVDGLRIAYRRVGSGPPLLLLHGILGDSRDWRPQLDGLAGDFDVIAWDAPGCGQSSDPPEDFSAADFAGSLAHFVESLGLHRPHVLGLSWGSGLALEAYRLRPDLWGSIVLASAYAGWKGSLPAEEVTRRLEQVLRESTMPPEDFVPGWLPGLFTDDAPAEVVDEVIAIMSEFHPVGYRAMALAFADLDLRPLLPTINVPTLLLYGELDKRSPLAVAHAMQAMIPGSELVVIPGVGHLANLEAPEAFNDAVRAFIGANTR